MINLNLYYLIFINDEKKLIIFFAFNERINYSYVKNIGEYLLFATSSINFLIKKISKTLFVSLVSPIIIYLYSK